MSRFTAMTRLAVALGVHKLRQRFRHPGPQAQRLLDLYATDRIEPLTSGERQALPAITRCINCGLCALAAAERLGQVHIPDLMTAYLRSYPQLAFAAADLEGSGADIEAAAAACPVGVPIHDVAAMVQRLMNVRQP